MSSNEEGKEEDTQSPWGNGKWAEAAVMQGGLEGTKGAETGGL